jgi:hypothetical protein
MIRRLGARSLRCRVGGVGSLNAALTPLTVQRAAATAQPLVVSLLDFPRRARCITLPRAGIHPHTSASATT